MKEQFSVVIFEGVDKVGKSTIYRAFNAMTNYKYFCIDRFTGSGYVYDQIYNRPDRHKEIISFEKEMIKNCRGRIFLVYLYCDKHILAERIRQLDEKAADRIKNIEAATSLYQDYLAETPFTKILIDTTKNSITENCKQIISEMKKKTI